MMERSNVYLDSDDKQRLKEIAKTQGIKYSEALRKAMKMYIVYHELSYEIPSEKDYK